MQKRFFLSIPLVIIASATLAIGGLTLFKKSTTPKKVHYHAGFQVYVDDKLQDFSAAKYMNESPCTLDKEKAEHDEDIQLEKAHLHDNVGNVVHVERVGAKWNDLFKNIGYKIPNGKPITIFVNGEETGKTLEHHIQSYDSVLIMVGKQKNRKDLLKKAVTIEEIKKAEKTGESC